MPRDFSHASLSALEANTSTASSPLVYTPPSESSGRSNLPPPQRRPSPLHSADPNSRSPQATHLSSSRNKIHADGAFDSDFESDGEGGDMAERPALYRPTDGRSEQPLLKDERGRPSYDSPHSSARPAFATQRSTFRSRSPDHEAQNATRKKYTMAAFFLGVSLISFVIQTETAVYIQHELKWNKAYCMLLVLPEPVPL
jgi:hypothetical protein